MGFKKRDAKLHTAVLGALPEGLRLSKRELIRTLRRNGVSDKVSVAKVQGALGDLIKDGRVVHEGARKNARFRRASA